MSHRELDQLAELRRRVFNIDNRLAAAKADPVVHLRDVNELRRERHRLVAELSKQSQASAT